MRRFVRNSLSTGEIFGRRQKRALGPREFGLTRNHAAAVAAGRFIMTSNSESIARFVREPGSGDKQGFDAFDPGSRIDRGKLAANGLSVGAGRTYARADGADPWA